MVGAGFRRYTRPGWLSWPNLATVAYGALGTPITLSPRHGGLDELKLSAMAGRQLPFFSLLVPGVDGLGVAGWRGVLGVVTGSPSRRGTFAVVQFLVSNFHGP